MNLNNYRTVFIGASLALILAATFPSLSIMIPLNGSGEHFSELWLLGPDHMAKDYPFNVTIGDEKQIFLGVGNHMGHSVYYVIYVKLRNQAENAPNSTTSTPSSLAPLYEYHAVIPDGETWEAPLTFSLLEGSHIETFFDVTKISINDVVFTGDYVSAWDSESLGFYYQLFFELWIYDSTVSSFKYQNHFVGLWLNVTI
jgi:hypothetical protein